MHYALYRCLRFFLVREWPNDKLLVTFSKFNAYFPHIIGCFHLQLYVEFNMTNVNVTLR